MQKILIVEDDKKIALALGARLKDAGYEMAFAYDAVQALTVARRFEPHLVVADITMPGGDGFTVIERLRKVPETANIPFIFMSASSLATIRERAMTLGAVDFFEKPYDADELIGAIALSLSLPYPHPPGSDPNDYEAERPLSLHQ